MEQNNVLEYQSRIDCYSDADQSPITLVDEVRTDSQYGKPKP